ncbi:type II secretion system F family protein [Patescibacteria group bacterium]
MAIYEYTARTQDGESKDGRLEMQSEKALGEHLSGQGLILTSAKVIGGKNKSIADRLHLGVRVSHVQKIFFTQNLQVMIRTGFSLANALHTLAMQTSNKGFRDIIITIQQDVESGKSFSDSIAKHSDVFSDLFINMIAAGEVSGKLDEVLNQLTVQMKKDHSLISKVKNALTYPAIVVTAMIGLGIAMMIFVIPNLLGVFEEGGIELPLPTRILISLTDFITQYGIYVLLGLVVVFIVLFRVSKTNKGKYYLHLIMLKTPIMGNILKKINLARFTRSLSSLLKTDIPIVQTLHIISRTLGNVHYRNVMIEASEQVKKGVSISSTLEKRPKLFTAIVTQMIHVGEESGTLDTIVSEIATFYEEDVDSTMANLSTVIEPILMLFLGAGVGVMAISIILPIYNLSEAI